MSKRFPELDRIRVTVDDAVRERHLAVIGDAVRSALAPRRRRYRLLVVAAALVLAVPVMALASENSVPGDLLYPIKRMLEPLVSVVDPTVEIDHRVREAEVLLERDAEPSLIRDQVERARVVLTDEHPEHTARLDVVIGRLEKHTDPEGDGDVPASDIPDADHQQEDGLHEPRRSDAGSSDQPVERINPPQETTTTVADEPITGPTDRSRDG